MIKQLTSRVGKYKKDMIISMIFMLLSVALEVIIPYLMSYIIDYGIAVSDMNQVLRIGLILLVASLSSLAFGLLSSVFLANFSAGFAKNVRQDLFHSISSFPFQSIDKFSGASLITRLTTDISGLQSTFALLVRVCSRSPWILIFSLIMAFNINSQLAMVFVFVLPLLAFLIVLIIRRAFPLFRKALKTLDKINNVMVENLKGIRVVKSFVREDFEIKKFSDVSKEIEESYSAAEKIIAFFQPTMVLAIYIATILIAWFGANLIVVEEMTIGQLMSFIIYINQILFALIMISMLFITLAMTRASAERIVEVFEEEITIKNPEHPIKDVPNGSIVFENMFFAYSDSKFVLENINLNIKSGETIGILGGTGSSKTSLVQLIPRLYDVNQGSIKVGGIDVRKLDMHKLRDNVSMVLQKNTLFTGSVLDNLKWGNMKAKQEEIEEACKIAQAHDFVIAMSDGYNTMIEQGGANLSGGQRQRLCIARAILKKPKVIIFDDSTSAVDTTTEAKILSGLKQTMPETTKIIISQRISSVQDLDRIILMDDRKIIAIGNHEELLKTSEIYREIEQSQSKRDEQEVS